MKKFALTVAALAVATSFSSAAMAEVGDVFVGKKGNENVVTKIKHMSAPNKIRIFLENSVSGKVRKFTVLYTDEGKIRRNTGKNAALKTFLAEQAAPIIEAEVEALEEERRVANINKGVTYVINKHGEMQALSTADRSTLLSRAMAVMGQ